MLKEFKDDIIKIAAAAVLFAVISFLPLNGIQKLLAYLIPYCIVGLDVLQSAVKSIAHGQVFNESFLMAIATVGAFILGKYPEAVMVMLLSQIGELFEGIASSRSRKSIEDLMQIRPDSATVIRSGAEYTVAPQAVSVGEIILIKPGEKVPLDAVVVNGSSSVDTSLLTGESLPAEKQAGDELLSGSVNLNGVLQAKTTSTFSKSTVSKILELVEQSAERKSKSETFIRRFARYYTPIVVVSAVLLACIPPLLFHQPFALWLTRALTFLVVSCPCALVISVPLAFFSGIGGASRNGILIKGANDLEALARAKTVVFDKTGTLTSGKFSVVHTEPVSITEQALLQLAASVERYSPHPIAQCILQKAEQEGLALQEIENLQEQAGLGLSAELLGHEILVGNAKMMQAHGLSADAKQDGATAVYVAVDLKPVGVLYVADTVKPQSKAAVQALKKLGIRKTVLLSGDKQSVCDRVQADLQLDEAYAQLLPQDKVTALETILKHRNAQQESVVFVGDGMNDAPVLMRADVGVAMGALGCDAAIEAADVVLTDDNPLKLAKAIKLAGKTVSIARFNIVFVLAVKVIVLILAAFGIANMWMAVFADVGIMILAVLNSMRILKKDKN